jgi:hypothetical protein
MARFSKVFFSQFYSLNGCANIFSNLVEISTTEHQPAGTSFNPNFQATFDLFFAHHYQAFTAENPPQPISREMVGQIVTGQLHLSTHNVIFR